MSAGEEDDPRRTGLDEHVDVLVLVESAFALGADQRGEASTCEVGPEGLGECGKDRVDQLGEEQTHRTTGASSQTRRPFVTQ